MVRRLAGRVPEASGPAKGRAVPYRAGPVVSRYTMLHQRLVEERRPDAKRYRERDVCFAEALVAAAAAVSASYC